MALSAFSEEQDPVARDEKPPASGFYAGACARYVALLHLSGSATADQDAMDSSRISLDDDLGLGAPSSVWEFGGRAVWWDSDYTLCLQGSYLRGRLRGHEIPETPLSFNGTVFAAGTPVDSAFRFDVARLLLDVSQTPDAALDFGVFAGLTAVGSSVAIESPSASTGEEWWQAALGGGLVLGVKPADWLSVEGRAGYFSDLFSVARLVLAGETTDVHTSIWDLSFMARVIPARFVTLEAGVRYFGACLKTDTGDEYNEIRWSSGGLVVGLSAQF
jgi:hypothetical protein